MPDFLILFLLLCLNLNISFARKTYQLYSIPSFTIDVTVQPGLERTNSTNQLLDFAEKLKSLAHAHLFEAFTSELYHHGNPNGENSALDSIELDMAIYDEYNGQEIRGELVGHILFIEERLNNLNNFEASPAVIRSVVKKAFGKDQLDTFFSRMRILLPNVQGVRVTTDVEKYTEEPVVTSTVPTVVKDNKNASGGRKGKGSNVIVVPMAIAITALAVGVFVYVRRDKRLHKSGHLLMDIDQYSECSDDDAFFGDLHLLDEASYESYDVEEGLQFVPVPAKYDENCDKRTKATLKEVTPKRYVQPDSPFELLYGAAFSHRDAAKVARVHGYKPSKSKYVKIAGRKIRKKPPLKPMQSISEVQEESPNESSTSQLQLDEDILNTKESLKETSDGSIVYRDFERHDATPCMMSDTVMYESLPIQIKNDEYQMTCSDELPKKDEQIDSFVDKLENLILAKSRHYEERKQLETEFLESRRKSKESQAQVNCQQLVSVSDYNVSPSPLEEHLHGKNHVAPQVMDILEMTEDVDECKIEHLESELLVSTNAFQEMDILEVNQKGDLESESFPSTDAPQVMHILGMTEDAKEYKIEHLESEPLVSTNATQEMDILEVNQKGDLESEPFPSTNAPQETDNLEMTEDAKECKIEHLESEPLVSTNAPQVMDNLEMTEDVDECKIEHLESELLVSTNAPQVMHILEMTEDAKECKIEASESEPLVSTNAPQVMHILEMTEDAKEYKIEATESEPLVSTNAPQVMDILEMTEDAKECKIEATESEPLVSTNAPQEKDLLEMTEDAKEYKIEATESEHFPSTDAPQVMDILEMTEDAKEYKIEATESEPFRSTTAPQEIQCLETTEDVKEYKIEHLESEPLVSTQDDGQIQDTPPSPSSQNQNDHDHDNMTEDNPVENHSSLSPLLQDTYKHDSKFNQKEETTLITLDKNGDDHDKTDK